MNLDEDNYAIYSYNENITAGKKNIKKKKNCVVAKFSENWFI
jgi:hypothetical protein